MGLTHTRVCIVRRRDTVTVDRRRDTVSTVVRQPILATLTRDVECKMYVIQDNILLLNIVCTSGIRSLTATCLSCKGMF